MRTAVAGTFNVLHEGHRRLIDAAAEGAEEVLVGITSDGMASAGRGRLNPFHLRRRGVEEYLNRKGVRYSVYEITDTYGPAVTEDIDVLVVSDETSGNGIRINEERVRRNLRPMEIRRVGMVADDRGEVMNAGSVMSGTYSRNGRRDAMPVSVGSLNPAKVEAVRTVMERIFGEVRIIPADVPSGVPEQPWGEDTCKGAVNRARAALGDSEMSVGIEAGVFEMYGGIYDVQYCAVVDRDGRETIGTGPGFRYPDAVADLLREGHTVGDAMRLLYPGDGRAKEGAVGVLSKGLLDRKTLTEQSVTAAMIPRM